MKREKEIDQTEADNKSNIINNNHGNAVKMKAKTAKMLQQP